MTSVFGTTPGTLWLNGSRFRYGRVCNDGSFGFANREQLELVWQNPCHGRGVTDDNARSRHRGLDFPDCHDVATGADVPSVDWLSRALPRGESPSEFGGPVATA
ncbi:MAG: hypothetical protein EXS35_13370 [Pedosphaera sp.]|nr:hypothetical protein [Pedosphaera sp.]